MVDKEKLVLIAAKLDKADAELFQEFCALRGEGVSSSLRRIILTELAKHNLLNDERKKALGVMNNGSNMDENTKGI